MGSNMRDESSQLPFLLAAFIFSNPVVVVPWDFSEFARRALDVAQQITATENIRTICVLEGPNPYEPGIIWGTVSEDVARSRCEEQFQEAVDESRFPGMVFHVAFGDPASEIVRYASVQRADLILIPSHGRTGLKRVLLGSVAEKVIRMAACPVLLLPQAWIDPPDHH